MAYFLDLFTPETWLAFRENGARVTGIPERFRRLAVERVGKGDIFLCYLTRLSRWCGLLQAESEVLDDNGPIPDFLTPYQVRFRVKSIVLLDPESAIPIKDDEVWRALSLTNRHDPRHSHWSGPFRSNSVYEIDEEDGRYLVDLLKGQLENPKPYPLTEKDKRQLSRRSKIRALDREVEVEVPAQDEDDDTFDSMAVDQPPATDSRESIQVQAKVARIGAEMGFHIWVPRSDRVRVLELIPVGMHNNFLEELPLNYDDTTLRTVEQIDVLWLKGRSMARAFEIEHTTAIYSGLLRMADLLALQPNMDIRLHIVAPVDRQERVLREIRRPVFSLLERGPLYEQCSFLSYDSVSSLNEEKSLSHMRDTIIADYEVSTEV